MTLPNLLEQLASYVPAPVAQAIYRRPEIPTEPSWRFIPAAVLFSDISGFTALSELLSQTGPIGAEELTTLINRYFTQMIQIIQSYQGQVVKFSGDALTVLFPAQQTSLPNAARRAAECALAMQTCMSQFTRLDTSLGTATLSMKVAVGAGNVLECNVGGLYGRWDYVVAGEPLSQVAIAEHQAKPGQIILSPQTWQLIVPHFNGTELGGGYMRLQEVYTPVPPTQPFHLDWRELSAHQKQQAENALISYVPGAIKAWLGHEFDWLAELRRLTIVFVGVGGIDYEADDAGNQLHQIVQAVRERVHRFEGSLNKVTVDDKGTVLLVLFGVPPYSYEDNPTRAVAFALDLQAAAQKQNWCISVGITEGAAFAGPVGAPSRREYTVIGDAVNLAARLMQYGRAGTIIVNERVKERAGPKFATENLGQVSLKGIALPQTLYLVSGFQNAQEEFVIRYLLHSDTLVGRHAEMEQIKAVMAKTQAGQFQLLTIEGELGLGKSHLASELVKEWMKAGGVSYGGKCVSYDRQIPYRVWREVLSGLYGLTPNLSPQRQLARLASGIASLEDPPDQPDYWANRLPLLADVLGLEAPDNAISRTISGQLRRNNTFALIEALLRREAARHPLLLLLEDVHWADELSLALAEYLAKQMVDSPLLLALVYRPMSANKISLLTDMLNLTRTSTIQLSPLSAQESNTLLTSLLNNKPLPLHTKEMLLNWGQGNPFFLQEIVASIQNTGNGSESISLDVLNLPESVQDVILARVDRLAEDEKLTLKTASVIGTRFQKSLLSTVHPVSHSQGILSTQLNRLEIERLIQLISPAPKWEYNFYNVLVQELVYEGLLLAQRKQLHESVGVALETLLPDEVEQLAYHYSHSGNWQKALFYLKAAAEKTRREYANQAAIGYYSQILNLQAQNAPGKIISAQYWDTLLERVKLYRLVGNWDLELEDLGTLGMLAEALADDFRRALTAMQWASFYEKNGDYDSSMELVERCVELARQAGAEELVGEGYNHWGKMLHLSGDYDSAFKYLQQALRIAQTHQNQSAQAESLNNLGNVAHFQMEFEVAVYFFEEAMALWRSVNNLAGLADSANNLGLVRYDTGQYMQAHLHFTDALDLYSTIGDKAGTALAKLNLGRVNLALGDYVSAGALLEAAFDVHQALGDPRRKAYNLCYLGLLNCRLLQHKTAHEFLAEAVRLSGEVNDLGLYGKSLTVYGWNLLEQGQLKEAQAQFETALKIQRDTHQEAAAAETLAHLGRAALIAADNYQAQLCAQSVLDFVQQKGAAGMELPGLLYLTCYQIFKSSQQPEQAGLALKLGHDYLTRQVVQFSNPAVQRSYLHNIPEHNTINQLAA